MSKPYLFSGIVIAVIAAGVIYNSISAQRDQFSLWKQEYGVSWTLQQQPYRQLIFHSNMLQIQLHNSNPSSSYLQQVNQFSYLSPSQFQLLMLNPKSQSDNSQSIDISIPILTTPIDWVQLGFVSNIKNQGRCGADYAFSATGIMESFALINKQNKTFSQQQIIDCSWAYQNQGCSAGDNYGALQFVKDHGITTEQAYPYIQKNQPCKIKGGDFKIKAINFAKGCQAMLTALQSRPIGVTVDATNWDKYRSGIFNNCNRTANHDVLLVGATDQYWKVKNSWGPTWGQDGYIRIKLGNTCGICQFKSPWVI